jgi:hypothetical protein
MNFYKAEYCTIIDSLWVRLIKDPVQQEVYWRAQDDNRNVDEKIKSFVATFRIKGSTTFSDIYEAGCKLWK